MVKHKNALSGVHLKKNWSKFVRIWFNQPAREYRRYLARKSIIKKVFPILISRQELNYQ